MAERAAKITAESLEFVGPPRRLVAVGDIPQLADGAEITGALAKYLGEGTAALRFRQAGRRGGARLSLRLDPRTPPGDYQGTLTAGKASWQVVARVQPETRVNVLAGDLSFVGAQGTTATAALALANEGNTEIHLPRALAIGLFDDDGLETAFAASYASPIKGIDSFVEVFHGTLRQAHSGIMKLAVTRGYGAHSPGTTFAAEFALDVARQLKVGHRYHGVASTNFAELAVSLSVTNGANA
jgi:hypothetical protein